MDDIQTLKAQVYDHLVAMEAIRKTLDQHQIEVDRLHREIKRQQAEPQNVLP
jgi:hypothetical protein